MHVRTFYETVRGAGIHFFTGVPDSLLKDFCAYITDNADKDNHIIAANEGNAVALAVGHYLGCGSPALVYMQNSGIGNAVNPLLSLADRDVYSIPMLLLIGWRGEPGVKDEPQHIKQGRIMPQLLDTIEVPSFILRAGENDQEQVVASAITRMRKDHGPVAMLAGKGVFEPYGSQKKGNDRYHLLREDAVKCVVDLLEPDDVVVSTTGMTSRELYEYRETLNAGHACDFLTVGSMGHASSIALGIAREQGDRRVICLDGDGALIMHMGAIGVIGQSGAVNLLHIVLNNGSHDSVGGQPTVGFGLDMVKIARACGYRNAVSVSSVDGIREAFSELINAPGPNFIEICVRRGARDDLGRPKSSPKQNRDALMNHMGSSGRME